MKAEARDAPRYLKDPGTFFSQEQRERTAKRSKEMDARTREVLRSQKVRAKGMEYFDEVLKYGGVRVVELKEFKQKGGKVVGTLCVMVPLEIVNAAGARSVRLCSGYYEPVHPANELLGDAGLCPMVRSTIGTVMMSSNPLVDLIDMVAGPATCDGKMKLGEMLEDHVPVVMMNIPRVRTGEASSRQWVDEMDFLARSLEALTGKRITRKALKKEIDRWNKAQELFARIAELRKLPRPPLSGKDALVIVQASQFDDIERWTRKLSELLDELKRMVKEGRYAGEDGAARVLLSGSPMMYPNFKVPNLIEESGGLIISDELCTGFRLMADPVMLDGTSRNEMMRALAERYLYPCTCPCFSPNDERIKRLKESIDRFGAEGVVFHTLRGCHLNNLEATKIELSLREMGVPMLKIESEYDEGDIEQVRTRVEAFVEMLKARRSRRGKGA